MSLSIFKKLAVVLDKQQKMKIAGLLVMILFGGILEILGVSLIMPLITAVLDEESFAANQYVILAMDILNIK